MVTETQRARLLDAFAALAGEGARAAGAELLGRWSEPQRHYHTPSHLMAVLDRLAPLRAYAADPVAVALAAWFHDAVYDPGADDNEERSARLAERLLPAGPRRAEVARLVRLTARHDPGGADRNGAALCDADLGVLAAPPEEYAAYTAAVRREYHFVPEAGFRAGRADILRRLLAKPRLFGTPWAAEHWEAAARDNVHAELRLLTG